MNTSAHKTRTRVAFAVLAASTLGLAGCASGASGSPSETTITPEASGTASPAAYGPGPSTDIGGPQSHLRDVRYCEIIPVTRKGTNLTATIYNTIGLNECPEDLWANITEDDVNAAYGSVETNLNGPRHWVLDGIDAQSGSQSASGNSWFFGGIQFGERGAVESKIGQSTVGETYTVNVVSRETTWKYDAGAVVFELTDPDGAIYTMQSYSLIVDENLTFDDLSTLAGVLDLPDGWSYANRTLDEPLDIVADGTAYVVDDDLYNAYMRRAAGAGG